MSRKQFDDHLQLRGLSAEPQGALVIPEYELVYFWLYNLSGQLVGYQRYNYKGVKTKDHAKEANIAAKYYTYISSEYKAKKIAVWGLHSIRKDTRRIFVVEGVWDAVKLHCIGVAAIAVLGTGRSHRLSGWLRLMSYRYHMIGLYDNDENDVGLDLAAVVDEGARVPAIFGDVSAMEIDDVEFLVSFF